MARRDHGKKPSNWLVAPRLLKATCNDSVIIVPCTGPYNVRVGVRKDNASGQFQLAARAPGNSTFTPVGSVQDTYLNATSYVEVNLGTNTFATTGLHEFRFFVTGKNASSVSYNLVVDYLRVIPTGQMETKHP